jgi:hypothetical protein
MLTIAITLVQQEPTTGRAGPTVAWVIMGLVVLFGACFAASRIYGRRRRR